MLKTNTFSFQHVQKKHFETKQNHLPGVTKEYLTSKKHGTFVTPGSFFCFFVWARFMAFPLSLLVASSSSRRQEGFHQDPHGSIGKKEVVEAWASFFFFFFFSGDFFFFFNNFLLLGFGFYSGFLVLLKRFSQSFSFLCPCLWFL